MKIEINTETKSLKVEPGTSIGELMEFILKFPDWKDWSFEGDTRTWEIPLFDDTKRCYGELDEHTYKLYTKDE